jgi:hypothetical protein
VSTLVAAVVSIAVLTASGALPCYVTMGRSWQALFVAPLAGSVVAGVAGACSLVVAGSTLTWFVTLSGIGFVISVLAVLVRRGRARTSSRDGGSDLSVYGSLATGVRRAAGCVAALVVVGCSIWELRPLKVPSVGFDARDIWLLRASWFADGHQALLSAFRNSQFLIAHASYPPLVSATVGVAWELTGNHNDRLGVVVIALLNACAVASTAWCLVEAGRTTAGRESRRGQLVPLAAGVLSGGLFVVVAFGIFGQFATNGYADPLWSAAAAGAVGFGLLLPRRRSYTAAAVVLLAVAGLTKVEGTATAIGIVALVAMRAALGTRPKRAAFKPVVLGLGGIVALGAWTAITRLEHTTSDGNTSGTLEGTASSRLRLTFDAMSPHLHVLLLAAPVAAASALLLAGLRRSSGMGNDLWGWASLAAGVAIVGAAYVTGPGDTSVWLLTSVHRTTMYPVVLAWLIVGIWLVVAATGTGRIRSPEPQGRSLRKGPDQEGRRPSRAGHRHCRRWRPSAVVSPGPRVLVVCAEALPETTTPAGIQSDKDSPFWSPTPL